MPRKLETITHSSVVVASCKECERLLDEGAGLFFYRDPKYGSSRLVCQHVRATS